ncbi:endospore germination permease [Caproiciproducens galactitolivorans]|uniref:GerAB/ArcD/ProY family transporter n=1 Tax=Caproiciproducens galactitolivorans TaxID=642589 RepID=UPI00240A60CC|nr:endospore germination permease [Caproiciproducens galactitolivorans]
MTKQTITEKQLRSLLCVFWGGSLMVSTSSSDVNQDFWISMLIAGVLIIPLFLIYTRIFTLYPNKNFFDILSMVFGKVIGKIICFVYVLFTIQIAAILMYIFSSFIRMLNMPETPEIATVALISLVAIMCVKQGPENIARMSKVVWEFIFVAISLTFVIGLRKMDFNNLKPILGVDLKTILGGAVTFCLLPLAEIPLCLPFFSCMDSSANFKKIFIKGSSLFIFLTTLANIRNTAVIGFPCSNMLFFPSYASVSLLSVGEFFTRFEVIIGLNLVLAGLIKICVCLYTASSGLAKVINLEDHKPLIIPLALITITFSLMAQSNVQELFRFLSVYPIYAFPFEIILPIIILIGAEIRTRTSKNGGSGGQATESGNQAQNPVDEKIPEPKHQKKSPYASV